MENRMEKIVSLAKRRGFIFPGSEIYGGLAGTWDYGPLGVYLKENIKREWWRQMLSEDHIYPLDAAVLMNAKVWEASGHTKEFSDWLVECKNCHHRFRPDEEIPGFKLDLLNPPELGGYAFSRRKLEEFACPHCHTKGNFTVPDKFNMMFKTHAGPLEYESAVIYLRPETAQGIFVNFKNIVDTFHPTPPFGIAQVGKAFRNEITPRNFLFRAREFEQMELEYFCHPDKAEGYFRDIREMRMGWFLSLGIKKENIRFRDYGSDELAHYSKATTDIEYRFGISQDGFSELEGIANRGDFDLASHAKASGEELKMEGVIPYVIEPSLGLDRAFLAFLMDSYVEDGDRVVLKLHPYLAPTKVAVFPLLANKPQLAEKARAIYQMLKPNFTVAWDDRGNIGKRYYSQDEVGTPFAVTVDFQTLEDDTVTVRDRDTMEQIRKPVSQLITYFNDKLTHV